MTGLCSAWNKAGAPGTSFSAGKPACRIGPKGDSPMKKQLQGIGLILVSILLMIGYGNEPFFDFSFRWSALFSLTGIVGVGMVFMPDKKD